MVSFVGNDNIDFTVTYQTDPYPCPFPRKFVDINRVYQGCVHNSSPASGNLHAANAIKAHACGPSQYRDPTTGCQNADPNCRNWDTLSGFCFVCNDLTTPPNGICQSSGGAVPVGCPSGTYSLGSSCVPNGCSGVDTNDVCTGCLSPREEVVGTRCQLKSCPSGKSLNQDGVCLGPREVVIGGQIM